MEMLDTVYHRLKTPKAPDIQSARKTADGKGLILTFDQVETELYAFEVSARNLPVRIMDEEGVVEIEEYQIHKFQLRLTCQREIRGKAFVSGMYGKNPQSWLMDDGSQLPVLCFHGYPVEE